MPLKMRIQILGVGLLALNGGASAVMPHPHNDPVAFEVGLLAEVEDELATGHGHNHRMPVLAVTLARERFLHIDERIACEGAAAAGSTR